jgi:hypothetical protein
MSISSAPVVSGETLSPSRLLLLLVLVLLLLLSCRFGACTPSVVRPIVRATPLRPHARD